MEDFRKPRVLIVEDYDAVADLLTAICADLNAEAVRVRSGSEGVALAGAGGFDLIVMDLRMPGMSGEDAIRAIRRLPQPNSSVPIIIFSGAPSDSIQAAMKAGADHIIWKPVKPSVLSAILADYLKKATSHGC